MERLSEREEMKGRIFFFLKFGQKNHLEKLQKGELFMNNFQYFIDRENEDGRKSIGDKYEASQVLNDVEVTLVDPETDETIIIGDIIQVTFRENELAQRPLFCLTAVDSDDFIIQEENNEFLKATLSISEERKTKIIEELGDYTLMIPPKIFLDRIEETLSKKNLELRHSTVRYTDYSTDDEKRISAYNKRQVDLFFWKDISLQYQKEYRLVVLNELVERSTTHDIGDLTDITHLYKTSEFLNKKIALEFKKTESEV